MKEVVEGVMIVVRWTVKNRMEMTVYINMRHGASGDVDNDYVTVNIIES